MWFFRSWAEYDHILNSSEINISGEIPIFADEIVEY